MILYKLRALLFVSAVILVSVPGFRLLSQQPTPAQAEVPRFFRAGQQAMQSGRFDTAITEFRKVLELQPGLVEAQVNLGLAYNARGDYALAVSELSRAASKRPDLLPADLFLGLSYMKLGSAGKAIPALRRALSIDPSNQVARRALATAEMSEGEYGEASADFQTLASKQPDQADAWFLLGHSYLTMAKQLTIDLSLNHRDSVWSLRLAGDVLGGRQLWNNAAQAYKRALRADPAQPALHAALGEALLRAGNTNDAAIQFKAELSRNAGALPARLGLAQVYLLTLNVPAALGEVARVWQSSPEYLAGALPDFSLGGLSPNTARQLVDTVQRKSSSPARQFLLVALYQLEGDLKSVSRERQEFDTSLKDAVAMEGKRGIAPSRSACEQRREDPCARFLLDQKRLQPMDLLLLGRTLLDIGRNGGAARAFSTALAENPADVEAEYWLSRSYLKLADAYFIRLAAAYPDSWRTYELQGETFQIRERDRQAIEAYEAAERLKPDDAKIHETLGELFLGEDSVQKATAELGKALQLNPGAPRSLYLLGRLYLSQREPARAIPYLETALRRDPGLLEARPVLGKAYLRAGKAALAVPQLQRSAKMDRYGNLHYLLYEAYRQEGKSRLAAQALARSQQLRRLSAAEDQAKIRTAYQE